MIGEAPILPAGWRLVSRDTVGSTNDEARAIARTGTGESVVVWALQQTAGRGRRGRPWSSPPGNLYVSFVVRPDCPVARMPQLGFAAALAVGEALAEFVPQSACVAYKWPNDVLVDDRKIAGILLESESGTGGDADFLVVGIGINLVASPADSERPATCIAALAATVPSPGMMLETLAAGWCAWLGRWRAAGFAPVREAWLAGAAALGHSITVRLGGGELCGRFRDIDHEGMLLLDTAGGLRRVSAGDVFPALR